MHRMNRKVGESNMVRTRQRHWIRRAAEREKAAVEAATNETQEEDAAADAIEKDNVEKQEDAIEQSKVTERVNDEFGPNNEYELWVWYGN